MRSRRLIAFSLSVSLMLASVACNALVGFGGLERVDGELTPDGSTELDDARPRRDGSTTDDAGEEPDSATTTLKRCNPNMPFGAPTRVEEFVDPIDSASAVLRAGRARGLLRLVLRRDAQASEASHARCRMAGRVGHPLEDGHADLAQLGRAEALSRGRDGGIAFLLPRHVPPPSKTSRPRRR